MMQFDFTIPPKVEEPRITISVPTAALIFRHATGSSLSDSINIVKNNFKEGPVDGILFGQMLGAWFSKEYEASIS